MASKFESKVKHRGATTLLLSLVKDEHETFIVGSTHTANAPAPPPLLTPVILQVIEYKLTVRVSYRTR